MQVELSENQDTYNLWTFLSGYGWWLLLAIGLIVVFLIKKFRNR